MMDIFQAASPLLDRQKAIHKLWVLYKLGTGGIFRLSQLFDHIIILTLFNHWKPLDEEIILHFYVSMHSHHESVWIGSSQASSGSESWGGSQALSWTEWNLPHSQQLKGDQIWAVFLTFYLLKPLVKVTTHVGSDCVLDCSLARGTEFGTVTIISMLQHFFYYFRLFCSRQTIWWVLKEAMLN